MITRIIQRYKDYLHEKRIKTLYQALLRSSTDVEFRHVWRAYVDAINSRSDAQVKRMEQEKGLCR